MLEKIVFISTFLLYFFIIIIQAISRVERNIVK